MRARFAWFTLAMVLVPLALLLSNDYVRIGPYGAVPVHGTAYYGMQFFMALLLLGLLALASGLAWPRFSLWFGPATRRRVLGLYGGIMAVAALGMWESEALARAVYRYEDGIVAVLHDELAPGMTLRQALQRGHAQCYGKHLTVGPDQADRVAVITFPGFHRPTRLVVHIDPAQDFLDSRMLSIDLLRDGRQVASK